MPTPIIPLSLNKAELTEAYAIIGRDSDSLIYVRVAHPKNPSIPYGYYLVPDKAIISYDDHGRVVLDAELLANTVLPPSNAHLGDVEDYNPYQYNYFEAVSELSKSALYLYNRNTWLESLSIASIVNRGRE